MKNNGFQKDRRSHTVLTVVFTIIAIAYLYPIFIVLVNSLKSNASINLDTFAFPASGTFMGLQNYIKGMTFGNYPFYRSVEYSLMITLLSSALILICTSMAAWYISRVDSLICRVVYYLCVFSMLQSPLPEMVSQPLPSNSHVILLSGIVPLATASSVANAEILSERSMQRASRIAVSFLVFIAVPPSFTNCRLQARW